MSQSVRRVPKLCTRRPSGRAYVYLEGKRVYLGPAGSADAHREYARIIQRISDPATASATIIGSRGADLTINELLAAYLVFAEKYYVKDGKPTSSVDRMKRVLRPLREQFGQLPASEFSPTRLKLLREACLGSAGNGERVVDRYARFWGWI